MRRTVLLSLPALTATLTLAACGGSSYSAGFLDDPPTASQTGAAPGGSSSSAAGRDGRQLDARQRPS